MEEDAGIQVSVFIKEPAHDLENDTEVIKINNPKSALSYLEISQLRTVSNKPSSTISAVPGSTGTANGS